MTMPGLTVLMTTVLTAAVLTVSTAYTAPSTQSKFLHVLRRSKLQAFSNSKTATEDPSSGFEAWYFHLSGDKEMQFQMSGKDRRCELREQTRGGDNVGWDVMGRHEMSGTFYINTPVSGMEEITFLQVHCGTKPALRMSWIRSRSGYRDGLFGNIRSRPGLSSDDVRKVYVGQRPHVRVPFVLLVDKGKIWFNINGVWRLRGDDVSGWRGGGCYFKAGAYPNKPTKESAVATTRFYQLKW